MGDQPPGRLGGWVANLVADHDVDRPVRDSEDEDWEPEGRMPPKYDAGLKQSKLIMRAYV